MTKDELMKKLYFDPNSDEEYNDAEFYLRVKGVAFHQKIMNHLGVDFNDDKSIIEWSKVTALLRYDKKLRNKIYIYIATLEEYIRAYLSNKYEDNPIQPFWKDGRSPRSKVKTRIIDGKSVSEVLQSIDFGDLLNQIKNIPAEDINEMFDCTIDIHSNLDAVRELRNAVSHHAFLMVYKFNTCIVEGIRNSSLEHNIKNLRQLLPREYRYGKKGSGGITAEIEACKYEKTNVNKKETRQLMKLDTRDIVSMI
ncbi:Abi family protein [Acholeplasma vituli]|uniref:Abi family protein n=1 Tax=Paracholeplasma vituli TaxID=69473 RepID=A0ABT2PU10_9MOLU|nr:Abi family protein [Paracholeplasma vituli]MCU0104421.1 Abi family protein [Paracholeplasma vituli]